VDDLIGVGRLEDLQTMKGKSNVNRGEDVVDPDELQLMDEYNNAWVQSWKKAIACRAHTIEVVATSLIEHPESEECAEHPNSMKQ
jgi:hypothetical protein